MQCPRCEFNDIPNLEEVKMHTKATCPECGAHIKKDWVATKTLVIETDAPREYMTYVLKQVKVSLNRGFVRGTSNVMSPRDTAVYHFEFDYK